MRLCAAISECGCDPSMRFLLYNIRYAAGIGRNFHFPVPYSGYFKNTNGNMKKILDFIGSVNPDIIGLIEVDSGSFRSQKKQPGGSHCLGIAARSCLPVEIPRHLGGPEAALAEKTGQCHFDQSGNCIPEVSLFPGRCQTPGN